MTYNNSFQWYVQVKLRDKILKLLDKYPQEPDHLDSLARPTKEDKLAALERVTSEIFL